MEKSIKLKKIKRKRKHGFFARSKTHSASLILKRRRNKKKRRLTI